MRTTVTLDPEAERLLKEAMRRRGISFKEALNRAVLEGLADLAASGAEPPFETEAFPMGILPGCNPTQLTRLHDEFEADAFLELTRKLEHQR
jgi:hypothetical protein